MSNVVSGLPLLPAVFTPRFIWVGGVTAGYTFLKSVPVQTGAVGLALVGSTITVNSVVYHVLGYQGETWLGSGGGRGIIDG